MAIELKGTIELKDITAVEFRCKCGSASICALKPDETPRVPLRCGNCDAHWQADSEAQVLIQFLRGITLHAAKERPYSLRLLLEGLEGFTAARRVP
jgi:hypothetical protein